MGPFAIRRAENRVAKIGLRVLLAIGPSIFLVCGMNESSSESPLVVIGITGAIGSGKSTVAQWLRDAGHVVYSSDDTARLLMDTDAELQKRLRDSFGDGIFLADNRINRSALSALVFGPSADHHARLALLNRIVHPAVLERHEEQLREAQSQGVSRVFIESALLYEVGLEEAFDYIIVVDAAEELRVQRVHQRSGLSVEAIRARMNEQISSTEKTKRADFVLHNDTSLDALRDAFNNLLPILAILPPREESNDDDETLDTEM